MNKAQANANLDAALRSDVELTRRLAQLRHHPTPTVDMAQDLAADAMRAGNATVMNEALSFVDILAPRGEA